jgi:ubiquitin C-terminal hydrolase
MRGLNNLGNTCYLNFILQILFNTAWFRDVFNEYVERIDPSERSHHPLYKTASAFQILMNQYHDTNVDACGLRDALQSFVQVFHQCHNQFGFGQQDGHEYLTFLMRSIHDSMYVERNMILSGAPASYGDRLEQQAIEAHRIDGSSTTERMLNGKHKGDQTCYDSSIFQVFSGQYRFQTQCRNTECEHVSKRFETLRWGEFPLGNPVLQDRNLLDVLKEYTSVTELEEKYECDKCAVRTNCFRRCTFWRLPEVLIISLKRGIHHFDRNSGRYLELKDDRKIQIPDTFDISTYCTAPRTNTSYELYATGNHFGATNGGHYYAQIKDGDKWKIANDEHIKEGRGPVEHVCLLFYRLN